MRSINTYLFKKWIGNERRKRRLAEQMHNENLSDTDGVDVKGPPIKRVSSGYNIFTSKMLSSGTRYCYNYNFPTSCSITFCKHYLFTVVLCTTTHASYCISLICHF